MTLWSSLQALTAKLYTKPTTIEIDKIPKTIAAFYWDIGTIVKALEIRRVIKKNRIATLTLTVIRIAKGIFP